MRRIAAKILVFSFAAGVGLALLAGCDAVDRYKFMSTVFDGYPRLPPAEEYCDQHAAGELEDDGSKAAEAESNQDSQDPQQQPSRHRPYAEKNCDHCHDKTKPDGLKRPPNKLCFMCHTGFIKGSQVHGPVAVGECLACHLPHSSGYPSLLKKSKKELCGSCHWESRLAEGMHDKLTERKFQCVECHDPHFGNARYFLK